MVILLKRGGALFRMYNKSGRGFDQLKNNCFFSEKTAMCHCRVQGDADYPG
jgi:hypothetical protein